MASLQLEKSLCDVTLQATDGHQFDAHRLVLSASSPYFKAMFTGHMEESQQRLVIIRLVNPPFLAQVVMLSVCAM